MDFEEMKVIWDSQNEQPLYAFDQKALHASVKRKQLKLIRSFFWRDLREISVGVIAGIIILADGILLAVENRGIFAEVRNETSWANHPALMFLAAGLVLMGPIYLMVAEWIQRKRKCEFDFTLEGELNKTLSQIDFQIQLWKTSTWWFLIPIHMGATLYSVIIIFLYGEKTFLLLPAFVIMLFSFILSVWSYPKNIVERLQVKRREFEALREKLIEKDL